MDSLGTHQKAPDVRGRPVPGSEARATQVATQAARPSPGIDYQRLYTYRFRDIDQARRQLVWREIARYVYARMGCPERVLDPAAGRGEFIMAVPAGERWAVDRVSYGDDALAGVKMIVADIMNADLPPEYFDGIFVSNFLEHLPDQDAIGAVLARLSAVMRHGGRIAIIGPNFRHCVKEYFDCADHTVTLSHVAVAEHLYAAGFEPVCVRSRFVPYSFRGRLPPSSLLTRIYLRTPLAWRLLGKQFLVIARKPLCILCSYYLMGPGVSYLTEIQRTRWRYAYFMPHVEPDGGTAMTESPGSGTREWAAAGNADELRVSVIVPARNEGEHIVPVLDRLFESVRLPCEVLVVVDSPADSTVPVVEEYQAKEPRIRCLVNTYGRGPANAIRFGIDAAEAPVAVVTMADGCDDPRQIDDLARLVDRGVSVAAASRYMPGGQQVGGPMLKGILSKLAGRSLRLLARIGTRDATNSFKAYSTEFVRQVGIESWAGFELGIELTAKAKRMRLPVAEIPTIWLDRQAGMSNFKLARWIPGYLRWYRFAFGPRLTAEQIRARGNRCRKEPASSKGR